MKLFTKEIEEKLQAQYKYGAELDNQKAIVKIFNPYGKELWYILNQDPNDPDYLWAIVKRNYLEMGSVSKKDLEGIRIKPFNLPLERDSGFRERNAREVWDGARRGERFGDGGSICEMPLSSRDSKVLNKKMESENKKTEKIAKWVKTGQIDGEEVIKVRDAAKKFRMSVNDLLLYIPKPE